MYRELGYLDFPLPAGKKAPPPFGWQRLAGRIAIPKGANRAVSTHNFALVDADTKEAAQKIYKLFRPSITTVVETRNGAHFWFAGRINNSQGNVAPNVDTRGIGGYGLVPDSEVDGYRYKFKEGHPLVRIDELIRIPEELKPNPKAIIRDVRNAPRYVMAIESIQGKYGSKGLVRACAVLRDGGYTEAQAMVILLQWNSSGKVQPPWSPDELARACSNTYLKRGAKNV